MAKITVTVRRDIGDPGTHPRYGALKPGAKIAIEEEDFGAELFERPSKGWLSPHEKKDAARAAELKRHVGGQAPPSPKGPAAEAVQDKKDTVKEVTDA